MEALADVEGFEVGDVEAAVAANGGDNLYELDSKTAECLIGPLTAKYGRRLPGPADLQPEQYATIESLTDLVFGGAPSRRVSTMGTFIEGKDLGSAWLAAYTTLGPTGELINLAVNITDPQQEDLGVRRAIEQRLVRAGVDGAQSMHTVANTIFPLGLYRPETENAAVRFMANVRAGAVGSEVRRRREWGTYIGRLTAYPSRDGEPTNQLDLALRRLKRTPHYDDAYECRSRCRVRQTPLSPGCNCTATSGSIA